jgi:hypothetical protein
MVMLARTGCLSGPLCLGVIAVALMHSRPVGQFKTPGGALYKEEKETLDGHLRLRALSLSSIPKQHNISLPSSITNLFHTSRLPKKSNKLWFKKRTAQDGSKSWTTGPGHRNRRLRITAGNISSVRRPPWTLDLSSNHLLWPLKTHLLFEGPNMSSSQAASLRSTGTASLFQSITKLDSMYENSWAGFLLDRYLRNWNCSGFAVSPLGT